MEVVIRVLCDDRGFSAKVEEGGDLLGRMQDPPRLGSCSWKWKKGPDREELFKEPNLAEICRRIGGPNWRQVGWRVVDGDGTSLCEFRSALKAPSGARPIVEGGA